METFYTMINCYSRGYYEVKSEMPQIAMFDAQTLNHIVNASDMIQNNFDNLYQRALLFGGVMLIVYSAEFGYIYLQLIVRELPADSIPGGAVFIIYAFFNFIVIISMVIQVLIFGSHVNMIDSKIRKELNDNRTSAIEAKSLCELGYIYKKRDGKPMSKENMTLLFDAQNEDGVTFYYSH